MTVNNKKWYQCHYRTFGISLIVISLLLIIGHIINYNLVNNQKRDSEKLITEILVNASKEKALIPDLIILNTKDTLINQTVLNDSLKKNLIKFISAKYTENSSKNKTFDISPYITDSEIKNEDKIIKHIEFLSSTVTKAVEDSRNQIDTEISKINTWISIWIGIIGFLGIFFPLIINIRSLDELKEVKLILDNSKSDVNNIETKMNTHEETLKNLNTKTQSLDSKTKNIENILKSIKLISKLKDIDDKFIIYNNNPNLFVGTILLELCVELQTINFTENVKVIKDILHQISYRLYTLSTYTFITKEIMEEMLSISEDIINSIDSISEDKSLKLIKRVELLGEKLKKMKLQ